jgi:oligoribonuclease NrnB/cAMP/cGMP phosphodiesterase (DHH superfamily)
MTPTVIFHNADYDGIFCREIARKFMPDAELIGWNFGDPPIKKPEGITDLYIMDLPCDAPLGLTSPGWIMASVEDGLRVTWIDHHKSSIECHPAGIPGYRIDGVAACRLAWQWFSTLERHDATPCCGYKSPLDMPYCVMWNEGNKVVQCHNCGQIALPEGTGKYYDRMVPEPFAVRLAGEYDIWDKRDPNAELFQHGLRSQELSAQDWSILVGMNGVPLVEKLLNQGTALQYAKTKENESIIKNIGFTFQWEGLTWLACNHARYNSFLFVAGLKPEHDACFGFKYNGKGKWEVSMYHAPGKEHHDLSVIAKKYGGGGHKGACGYITRGLPFEY